MLVRAFSLAAALAIFSTSARAGSLEELYLARQWFELRERANGEGVPAFYRGAVALAFNQPEVAERHFKTLIREAPASWEAVEARRLLSTWYSFTGRNKRALREYTAYSARVPGNEGVERELQERTVWSRYPELSVKKRRHARVPFVLIDGDIFLPLSVNGIQARYLIDTGANQSLISESEARRAGMRIDEARGLRFHDASGAHNGYRIAVARNLSLGGFQLRNVVFLVVPDGRLPFANLPAGSRGILGLPVLHAWRTVRWTHEGMFEAGFQSEMTADTPPNLCFSGEGPHLLTRGEFAGAPLAGVLDTGAIKSRLLPSFATAFEGHVRQHSRTAADDIRSIGGSKHVEAYTLPQIELRMGGMELVLRPAVLIKQDPFGQTRYHLWLGSDLLQQASQVTIDFQAMSFAMR